MGQVIGVNIKWKHLVIGLDERYSEIMNKGKNMIITIIDCSLLNFCWVGLSVVSQK